MHTTQRKVLRGVLVAAMASLVGPGIAGGQSSPEGVGTTIPVYGGPTYTPGVGGIAPQEYLHPRKQVNNNGVAVSFGYGRDALGNYLGERAFRWDSSGVAPLGLLGSGAGGVIDNAFPTAINDSGKSVGFVTKYDGSGTNLGPRAVVWSSPGTTAVELPNLSTKAGGIADSRAFSLNAGGTVLGISTLYDASGNDLGPRAVRWNAAGTTVTELGNLGTNNAGFTEAAMYDVNASGTAIGSANKYDAGNNNDGFRAVRWDAAGTAATPLGIINTDLNGSTRTVAFAINDAGTSVGRAEKFDVLGANLGFHAVRWDAGGTTATVLQALGTGADGAAGGTADAINAAGVAVGSADVYDAAHQYKGYRAVRWDPSGTTPTELGNLGTALDGTTRATAEAINDSGLIVGWADDYDALGVSHDERAVYWGFDGVAVDLNTLIDPTSGWTLMHAYDVSNTGWIAGVGLFDPDGGGVQEAYARAFLLQVPEPAGAVVGGCALILLGRARRRNRAEDRRRG